MIDEELYKIATDELNSDDRKPDVWARACALASDDHDEARFLYTNLRVEEMLNKDGKQRTFSADRQRDGELSGADKLETLELTLEDEAPGPSSRPTGVTDNHVPLPIDDILGYDANDADPPSSTAGNAVASDTADANDDSWTELDSLEQKNGSGAGALSNLTGKAVERSKAADRAELEDFNESDIIAASNSGVGNSSVGSERQSPESQRTARLSENLERQFDAMDNEKLDQKSDAIANVDPVEDSTHLQARAPAVNAPTTQTPVATDTTRLLQENTQHDAVRTDYADSDILDEEIMMDVDSELDTGEGRSFMVFSRNGALKAIKRGVSWPALLFTFPWLLSKAMFGTAIVYGCLWLVTLAGLFTTANHWMAAGADATLGIKLWTAAFALLALIGLLYIPFRYGNRWVADKLQNRGFEFESAVSASNKNDAMDRLLSHSD